MANLTYYNLGKSRPAQVPWKGEAGFGVKRKLFSSHWSVEGTRWPIMTAHV